MGARDLYNKHGFVGLKEAVVIHVGTTGPDPKSDRIVDLALFRLDFGKVTAASKELTGSIKTTKVDPGVPIPAVSTRTHGVRQEDLKDAPKFDEVAKDLREYIGDLPVIGHDVAFHKAFLSAEFKRAKVKTLHRNKGHCTMKRTRELRGYGGGGWVDTNLNDTALLLDVDLRLDTPHSALDAVNFVTRIAGEYHLLDNGMRGDPREYLGIDEEEDEEEEDLYEDDEDDYYEARSRERRRRRGYTHHPRDEGEEGEEGKLPSGCGAAIVVALIIALLMMLIL